MILSNIHTHSVFSDGAATLRDMLERAVALGFVSFGASDHSDTPCDSSYCMKKEAYAAYLAEAGALKAAYADRIEYFCGIEKDAQSEIDPASFDYVIGSVHYLIGRDGTCYAVDHALDQQMAFIRNEGGGDKLELARRYFDEVVRHAETGLFSIQGHFDVITKFGLFDDAGPAYEKIALDALDAVLDRVPYLEVNTGAVYRGLRQAPFPAAFLLRRARERGGKLILSGDSHALPAVDFFFREEERALKDLGFTSLYRLRKSGFEEVSI